MAHSNLSSFSGRSLLLFEGFLLSLIQHYKHCRQLPLMVEWESEGRESDRRESEGWLKVKNEKINLD